MERDPSLDNVVVFDLPDAYDAKCLCAFLQADRLTWLFERVGRSLVGASLGAEAADLGVLLRTVESWAGRRGLGSVGFEVDGRSYVLLAAPAPVS